MAQAQMVGFQLVKEGGAPLDWEDYFGYATEDPRGGAARCVVLDGAAEAFDSQRWVKQLAEGFLAVREPTPVHLAKPDVLTWIGQMQQRWLEEGGSGDLNPFEEIKARDGSLATFLGCQINGLNGTAPTWRAVSLGDVVLFHVRAGQLIATFPDLGCGDFGIDPIGVFTLPQMRARMEGSIDESKDHQLEVGDILYLASDAFAEWLVCSKPKTPWGFLADLDDMQVFEHFVVGLRAAKELKNDDVTLLRVEITVGDPECFVVGR